MPLKLEQSFLVAAPLETVWDALTDVERVAPCLPGATLGPGPAEGVYAGTFAVRLGPASAAYEGTLEMASVEQATHTTTMRASGRDRRGQGSANATIVSRLVPDETGTRVEVVTDFTITGRLARFGRGGMVQDVSNRLLAEFASCLQDQLAGPADAPGAETAAQGGDDGPAQGGEDGPAQTPGASPAARTPPPAGAPAGTAPSPPPAGRPINGLALIVSILRDRLRRLLRRRR